MLDKLKDLGFKYSTVAGITISYADINVYSKKKEMVEATEAEINEIEEWFEDGLLTDSERRKLVIDKWTNVKNDIQSGIMKEFDKDNNIFMMSDSGARGNVSNFTQLVGMRGLMSNPKGETVEVPVKSSFREGLTVAEFFISTHGARKGLADTALKTADSGYLTRRLVDVAQDVIIHDHDCQTDKGIVATEIRIGKEHIESLEERIAGRYISKPLYHPEDPERIICSPDDENEEYIDDERAKDIANLGITNVSIRSVLTCDSAIGVCRKCYGKDLATGDIVEIGEAVGVMAAQSI